MNTKLRFASLQSGSNGNCVFVETSGIRLLFDAGLTGLQTQQRLESIGVDIRMIADLLGHTSLTSVLKYAKATNKLRLEAVNKLPQIALL